MGKNISVCYHGWINFCQAVHLPLVWTTYAEKFKFKLKGCFIIMTVLRVTQ